MHRDRFVGEMTLVLDPSYFNVSAGGGLFHESGHNAHRYLLWGAIPCQEGLFRL